MGDYLFHQTPPDLCQKLIQYVPIQDGDSLLEPFKGEGGFYNNFPANTTHHWCEIQQGKCYTSFTEKVDWVITNPPFRLEVDGKKVGSFHTLLFHFLDIANKGICFLGNHNCWGSLTPIRMTELNRRGWYLQKAVVCNIKKWAGRYYFMIFTKQQNDIFPVILGSH